MSERKSCEDTKVPVERSRGAMAKVLAAWGARGVQWEDDFDTGDATLRFRWKTGDEELVARLKLVVKGGLQGRSREKVREQERRRLHRVAFHWLRAQHAAVQSGLFTAETVIIPWLEDASGTTLGEALAGQLGTIAQSDVAKRLMITGGA